MPLLTIGRGRPLAGERQTVRRTEDDHSMKPSCAIVTALLLSSASPLQLYADTWGPPTPKAALSPSGRFEARTSVGDPASLALWDRGSRKRIYETNLVNSMSTR
jgi:hypothetical protein